MADQKGNRLPVDANGNPIQVALSEVFDDATSGTVQTSPVTSATVLTFVPPANAVIFWFRASVAGRFGDNVTMDASAAGKGWATYDVNTWLSVTVAGGNNVYVLPDSSAAVDFRFEVVE